MTPSAPIKPRRLKPGDTIGIVAPSSPFEQDAFDKGLAFLHDLGFQTRLADGLFNRKGYLAGGDQQRLGQLNQMFADDGIDAIVCARGGFGVLKIIDGLDYDLIGDHPKAVVGFSDITALHQALFQKLGLVTFHGPMVTGLDEADDLSREAWGAVLMGDRPVRVCAPKVQPLVSGAARGVVLGGNLATLCHLVGTPFNLAFDRAILVIEETNEPLYRLDRMLTQMKLAGCFQGVAGVALGDFSGCGPVSDIMDLMRACFNSLSVPVAAGFPWGHSGSNVTIPLGLTACLDADAGELVFDEAATIE